VSKHWRHNRHGPKIRQLCPFTGELGPHLTQCGLGRGLPPYQMASWSSSRLATTDMGRKLGGCAPFFGGEGAGSHLAQCGLGRGLPPCQVASWSIQPFGHNRYGLKTGGLCPFGGDGAGSPSNTMWPGPRPTCTPSCNLIHPTVWPQYTNQRHIQTGQDRQQSDSIEWTIYKWSPKNEIFSLKKLSTK